VRATRMNECVASKRATYSRRTPPPLVANVTERPDHHRAQRDEEDEILNDIENIEGNVQPLEEDALHDAKVHAAPRQHHGRETGEVKPCPAWDKRSSHK